MRQPLRGTGCCFRVHMGMHAACGSGDPTHSTCRGMPPLLRCTHERCGMTPPHMCTAYHQTSASTRKQWSTFCAPKLCRQLHESGTHLNHAPMKTLIDSIACCCAVKKWCCEGAVLSRVQASAVAFRYCGGTHVTTPEAPHLWHLPRLCKLRDVGHPVVPQLLVTRVESHPRQRWRPLVHLLHSFGKADGQAQVHLDSHIVHAMPAKVWAQGMRAGSFAHACACKAAAQAAVARRYELFEFDSGARVKEELCQAVGFEVKFDSGQWWGLSSSSSLTAVHGWGLSLSSTAAQGWRKSCASRVTQRTESMLAHLCALCSGPGGVPVLSQSSCRWAAHRDAQCAAMRTPGAGSTGRPLRLASPST
eukprot:365930-Chlamydomonas_euryale.AAC.26